MRAETALRLRSSIEERGLTPEQDAPLFVSTRGMPLTRYGVLRIVQRHARRATETMPTLKSKRIGAHTFRHAAAVHLLRSGNELTVVPAGLDMSAWKPHITTPILISRRNEKHLKLANPSPTPVKNRLGTRTPILLPGWKPFEYVTSSPIGTKAEGVF